MNLKRTTSPRQHGVPPGRELSKGLSEERHLTDVQYADFAFGMLAQKAASRVREHLKSCDQCLLELLRREAEVAYWDTPAGKARMEQKQRELLHEFATVFTARDGMVIQVGRSGAEIPVTEDERTSASQLLEACRAIVRGGGAWQRDRIAANVLMMQPGQTRFFKSIPTFTRMSSLKAQDLRVFRATRSEPSPW